MRRITYLSLAVAFCASLIITQGLYAQAAKTETLKGYIIDSRCASANKDKLGEFVKTHTKECVLMPACKASGFNIYTPDGKLTKFDQASNEKIAEFLEKPDSKLHVEVTAKSVGEELSLVSIRNLK